MQPVAAVGHVRRADVLARGDQVLGAHRQQGAEGNLKRQRREVDVVVAGRRRVQVDAVAADADRIRILERRDARRGASRFSCSRLRAAMLLEHGRHGPDAPRLAHIGVLGDAIFGADDVAAEPEFAPAGLAVRAWGLGLEPVEQRQAQLLRRIDMAAPVLVGDPDEIAAHVIVLRPVHRREIARVRAGQEVRAVRDAPVPPQVEQLALLVADRIEGVMPRREGDGMAAREREQAPRPWRREARHVVAPERVIARSIDGVIGARHDVHHEDRGKSLLIAGVGLLRHVRLAGRTPALASGDELRTRERQEVAQLGRVDEAGSLQHPLDPGPQIPHR